MNGNPLGRFPIGKPEAVRRAGRTVETGIVGTAETVGRTVGMVGAGNSGRGVGGVTVGLGVGVGVVVGGDGVGVGVGVGIGGPPPSRFTCNL